MLRLLIFMKESERVSLEGIRAFPEPGAGDPPGDPDKAEPGRKFTPRHGMVRTPGRGYSAISLIEPTPPWMSRRIFTLAVWLASLT